MTKSLRIVGVLFLTLISMFFAFRGIDFAEMLSGIQTANLLVFRCCMSWLSRCPCTTNASIVAAHWIPRFIRISSFPINSIGFLAINVIPLRMGELVRPYLLAEKEEIPFGEAMVAIVLERWLDMIMLLIMLFGLGWFIDLPNGVVVQGIDILTVGQKTLGTMVLLGFFGLAGLIAFGEPLLQPSEDTLSSHLIQRLVFCVVIERRSPSPVRQSFIGTASILYLVCHMGNHDVGYLVWSTWISRFPTYDWCRSGQYGRSRWWEWWWHRRLDSLECMSCFALQPFGFGESIK